MFLFHRTLLAACILLQAPLTFAAAHSDAGDYPSRKITFVVGFAAGGGVDTLARVVAQELTERFGYQIVVENRPGAASNIAAKAVAGAVPDGYTLLFTGNSWAINQTLYKNQGYATEDLRPVAFAALDSVALAVNAGNKARTLRDLLDAAKEKPISLGFGGSAARIAGEYVFKVLAKAPVTPVPFQSGAPALNALLGNHVDVIAGSIAEVNPQVQQGNVRVLAVTGPKRVGVFPDVPTLAEVGFPGIELNGWIGLLAPAKTPNDVCATLHEKINAVVQRPNVDQRLRALGYEPNAAAFADAAPFLKSQIAIWGRMIRETGITAD